MRTGSPYLKALASPGALRFSAAGILGRLPISMYGLGTVWAMPGLAALTVVIFCSGLGMSPTLISGFSLMEQQAPATRQAEGMAWLTSAISVGTAAGSAAAGQIVDAGGARWGYAFAAACAAGAVLACVLGLGRLSVPGPDLAPASADAQA